MKVTGIGLLVICFALVMFAATSHFVLTDPGPGNPQPASPPGATAFSPLLSLIVGGIAGIAGAAILIYGGRGYSEKKLSRSANPNHV